MSQFVDRRQNGKNKNTIVNRDRFMRRFKKQIREAVSNAISKRSIKTIEQGEKVTIPAKDLKEPMFHTSKGGRRELVHPGNREFIQGDRIKRPPSSSDSGASNASNEGEGEDNFGFEISREEFLNLFFEDLELPNLVKTQIKKMLSYKTVRAGYTSTGVPANINIIRSMRGALSRRVAIGSKNKKKLKTLQTELEQLKEETPQDADKISAIQEQIRKLKAKIEKIPFIDPFDIKYNNRVKEATPSTSAVMFCLMDVSGSMDEAKKEVAKKFFILLYLFLKRSYDNVEVVFIRHHTSAKEVTEEEFFYSRETGGTVVSSALDLMQEIMHARYPANEWNIYAAQASDGDNWNNDSPRCKELLENNILAHVRYFAYVEILPRHHQSLWEAYLGVKKHHKNFAMQNIEHARDIYPVFRELFKKNEHKQASL